MDDEGIDDFCIENSHENGKGNLRNSSSSDTEGMAIPVMEFQVRIKKVLA